MKRALVDDLACPLCDGDLVLEATGEAEVETGELLCRTCGARWLIRDGTPRLVPPDLVGQQEKTSESFGWQWQHFSEWHPEFEAQFLDWIYPLEPSSFRGKRVLDAGCGTGRHAFHAASYGAEAVIALDLSSAVDAARENLREVDSVHVVQGDLLRPPFRTSANGGGFDLIYSIGVLHHLPDPYAGFQTLLHYLRPGGTIAIWVYGYENNGLVRNAVEPLRRISTRVPPPLVRGLAWPLAVGFHAVARGIYKPLPRRISRHLPLSEYMISVADFSFRQNYGIVFDQLAAPTATYLRGSEVKRWFAEAGLDQIEISHRHGNSWRGQGRMSLDMT